MWALGVIVLIVSVGTLVSLPGLQIVVFVAAILTGGVLMIAGNHAVHTLRCPWCGEKAAELFFNGLSVNHVKSCPHCERSLGDDVVAGKKKETALDDELA